MQKPPDYSSLRVVGCLCYAAKKTSDKLAPRATKCIFLGYPYAQKGYKLYDLDNKVILLSRDVVFQEDIFPFKQPMLTHSVPDFYFPQIQLGSDDEFFESSLNTNESDTSNSPVIPDDSFPHPDDETPSSSHTVPVLRRSARPTHVPSKYKDFQLTNLSTSQAFNVIVDPCGSFYDQNHLASLANVLSVHEPTSYAQAKQDPKWVEAMDKELAALDTNQTWELTALPPYKTAIACKWVFKSKFNPDGTLERCKARLVARGDKQIKGKDYKHTFSPVAKFTTIRVLIALAATKNWELHQLDINNAFFHGYIEEELYMLPPPGLTVPPGLVCKLRRSIYGL